MRYRNRNRRGFTMIELFAVLLITSMLVVLLLPSVQSAREMARRTSCANNLTQLTLAVSTYHAAFSQLPVQLSGTDGSLEANADNDRRLSFLVGLLPHLGKRNLADDIRSQLPRVRADELAEDAWLLQSEYTLEDEYEEADSDDESIEVWVAGGPEPFAVGYGPWRTEVAPLRCPSDPGIGDRFGRTNYAACLGDGLVGLATGPMREDPNGQFVVDPELAEQTTAAMRGAFVPRVITSWRDITDGRAHTILLGEVATALGDRDIRTYPVVAPDEATLRDQPDWVSRSGLIDPDRPMFWSNRGTGSVLDNDPTARRGLRWSDGMPLYTGFNTILPPNREIALSAEQDNSSGVLPPSSRHDGGIQIALADGSVRFVSNSIEAGDPSTPTVYVGSQIPPGSESPYGVWGALGTRSAGELATHFQ